MVEDNTIFKTFIPELTAVLQSNEDANLGTQKDQLGKLFSLEEKFKATLQSSQAGREMYKRFVKYIVKERGNTLTYPSYFREDGDLLLKSINKIFEKGDIQLLMGFKINYVFVKWIMDRYKGPKKTLSDLCDQIVVARKTLCEDNLPLAINRAKIFFTKRKDLDYMDVIEVASEGLIHAIDKFTLFRGDFGNVAIGRMMVHMDNESSKTMIRLPPKDRRILYRYNNAVNREKLHGDDEILAYVRQSFKDVTLERLHALITAVSTTVSIDEKRDDSLSILEKTASEGNPEEETIQEDLKFRLRLVMGRLLIPERKVVRLKSNL